MEYDPTREALFHPERAEPVADFGADWQRDRICAELSRLAYYRFEDDDGLRLREALAGRGFGVPRPFVDAAAGAQGFGTVARDGTVYVAFRGTQPDSLRDLRADADAALVAWPPGGRVHRGFRDTFLAVRVAVDAWLGEAGDGDLVVTGHSLGAAMATVMASVQDRATLVTFGSPRVGDGAFVALFAGRDARRYADCTDIVSRLPPPIVYRHVSKMHYVDRVGTVHFPPPDDAYIRADRLKASAAYVAKHAWKFWKNVPARSGADHAPINYVSAVLGRRTGS